MKIQLVDYNEELCIEWRKAFEGCNDVEVHCADYFSVPTDCYCSPANSYGFLDGGIDNKFRKFYERNNIDVEKKLQDIIIGEFNNELLVGQSVFLEFSRYTNKVPALIVAPTMRVPMKLSKDSVNVYLAMKAILNRLKYLENFSPKLKSISISGLGTGIGQLPYDLCVKQMKQAYNDFWVGEDYFPNSWGKAQDHHQLLYSDEVSGDLQYDKPKN